MLMIGTAADNHARKLALARTQGDREGKDAVETLKGQDVLNRESSGNIHVSTLCLIPNEHLA
jgi:hypothetical protein